MSDNGGGATLPGGYWTGDRLEKDIVFSPLNGHAEQALLDIESSGQSSPGYVTAMLGTMIDKVGRQQFGKEQAAGLCVADRQWLMVQMARRWNGDSIWLTSTCETCSESFDIPLDLSELPTRVAGKGFPSFHLSVHGCDVLLRVPTGSDQQTLTDMNDASASGLLLKRCVLTVDGKPPEEQWFDALSDVVIQSIETALEDASPAVATAMAVRCPECGADQVVKLNPYGFFRTGLNGLLEEIHMLAWYYHWSEQDILSLTRQRRRAYLQLIDTSRGMAA